MKKLTLKYLLGMTMVLSLTISGCESFLDKNPQGELTQASFPVTSSDALLATNAAYATLRNGGFNSGTFPIMDIMSDDANKGSNPGDAAANIGVYDNFTFTTTGGELSSWWATLYEGIKRANVVIVKVPEIEMDVALRNRYVGEAKFLRALYYFDLVRAWGGVPIVTVLSPATTLPRSTKEEVYTLIKEDLLYAIENLTEKDALPATDAGRATKGAARGLLAKVYLFEGDFVNAEKYALDVITSQKYDLEPVFADASSVAGEHGIESVFEIGSVAAEAESGNQFANVQGVRGNPNRGWGFNRPSVDLRDSFENGDPRLKGTIIDLGDVLDGVTIEGDGTTPDVTKDAEGKTIEIECYNRKVWTPGEDVASQFGHNRRLLRYSDVLLIAAEALNENNKPSDALVYLNMVRARAREGNAAILPDITETDKNVLRAIILNERRHELAMEGHRFWDLVRTGKAVDVLGPLGYKSGKHELFPIPQAELDLSQGSLTQNPGWVQ